MFTLDPITARAPGYPVEAAVMLNTSGLFRGGEGGLDPDLDPVLSIAMEAARSARFLGLGSGHTRVKRQEHQCLELFLYVRQVAHFSWATLLMCSKIGRQGHFAVKKSQPSVIPVKNLAISCSFRANNKQFT